MGLKNMSGLSWQKNIDNNTNIATCKWLLRSQGLKLLLLGELVFSEQFPEVITVKSVPKSSSSVGL